jgi:hypothetical protein
MRRVDRHLPHLKRRLDVLRDFGLHPDVGSPLLWERRQEPSQRPTRCLSAPIAFSVAKLPQCFARRRRRKFYPEAFEPINFLPRGPMWASATTSSPFRRRRWDPSRHSTGRLLSARAYCPGRSLGCIRRALTRRRMTPRQSSVSSPPVMARCRLALTISFSSFPTLKKGRRLAGTGTGCPVRGLRPL